MGDCCGPRGYEQMFGDSFARRMAKRYRRRGLDRTARRLVGFLVEDGAAAGATVLEVGGGVGEVGLELLRHGAASVTNVELSPAYDAEALRLAGEAGVADRVQRRIGDVAVTPDLAEPADLVVLHRVVCCYPDYARLLGTVAHLCRHRLAFSHPPRNAVSRTLLAGENAACALTGRDFRAFVHPPAAMIEVLTSRGLRPTMAHKGWLWRAEGLTR